MSRYAVKPSKKKQIAINNIENLPFTLGERIYVNDAYLEKSYGKLEDREVEIVKVNKDTLNVKLIDKSYGRGVYTITFDKVVQRSDALYYAGANPIDLYTTNVKYLSCSFESILHHTDFNPRDDKKWYLDDAKTIEFKEFNWNPYVYNKDGDKVYFQRGFVWALKDEQLLIESIYQGIDCGRILIRKRSWEKLEQLAATGERELYFKDIIDGKQRLNTMFRFLRNEFPDIHGNYYNDLSNYAQRKVSDNSLFAFAELDENTTDEEVINQFLKVNFTGKVMSLDHINYVRSIKLK